MKIQIHNHTSFQLDSYQQLLTQLFHTIEEKKQLHLIFVTQKKYNNLMPFFVKKILSQMFYPSLTTFFLKNI